MAQRSHASPARFPAENSSLQQHGRQLLPPDKPAQQQPQEVAKPVRNQTQTHVVVQLLCYIGLFTAGLIFVSDMQLRHFPEHFTTSLWTPHLKGATPLPIGAKGHAHWMWHVYGYMLTVRSVSAVLCICVYQSACLHQAHMFVASALPCHIIKWYVCIAEARLDAFIHVRYPNMDHHVLSQSYLALSDASLVLYCSFETEIQWHCCRVLTLHPTLACGGTSLQKCSPAGRYPLRLCSALP